MSEEVNEMNLNNELKMLAEDLHANDNHKHSVAKRIAADELTNGKSK